MRAASVQNDETVHGNLKSDLPIPTESVSESSLRGRTVLRLNDRGGHVAAKLLFDNDQLDRWLNVSLLMDHRRRDIVAERPTPVHAPCTVLMHSQSYEVAFISRKEHGIVTILVEDMRAAYKDVAITCSGAAELPYGSRFAKGFLSPCPAFLDKIQIDRTLDKIHTKQGGTMRTDRGART